jgi:hypothetical protein
LNIGFRFSLVLADGSAQALHTAHLFDMHAAAGMSGMGQVAPEKAKVAIVAAIGAYKEGRTCEGRTPSLLFFWICR